MPVRAVTPRVVAARSIVHPWDCAGDCCHHDAANDERVTGENIYASDWPDRPLRVTFPNVGD